MSGPVVFTPPFKTLVTGVAAQFALYKAAGLIDFDIVVARGWKERAKQINQGSGRANRVVFMPSKPDGSAGKIVKPRQVGDHQYGAVPTANPPIPPAGTWRPLSDWERIVYVSIWAYDGTQATDEGAQDDAVYQLFRWTQIAVQNSVGGNADFGTTNYTVPLERSFGLELLVDLTFQFPIPDVPEEYTRPNPVMNKPA